MEKTSFFFMNIGFLVTLAGLTMMMVQSVVRGCRRRVVGSKKIPESVAFFASNTDSGSKDIERRTFSASYTATGIKAPATVKDLSIEGAFVICGSPLAPNRTLLLTMDLPDAAPFVQRAKVVWNNCNVSDNDIRVRGMRIRFLGMTPASRTLVQHLMNDGAQPPCDPILRPLSCP